MLNVLGALDSLIGANSIPLPPPTPADSTNSAYSDFSNLLDSFSQKPKNDSNIPKDINKLFQDILTLFQNISSLMSNAITNINQESSKDNIKIDISKIDSTAKSQIVNVLKDVEDLLEDTTKDNPALSTIDDIIKDIQNPSKNQDFVLSISIKEEYVSTTTNDFLGSTLSNLDKYILSNKDISSYISSFSFSVVLEQDDTSIPIFSIKAQKPESKDENANNIPSSKISNQDPTPTKDLGNNVDTTPKEDDQAIKISIPNTNNLSSSQTSNDTNIKSDANFLTISARYISDNSNKNVFEYSFKGIKITVDTSIYNNHVKIDKPLSTTKDDSKDDSNKKLSNDDIKPNINLKSDTPNIQVKSSDSQNIPQADVQTPKDKPIPSQNQDAIKTDTTNKVLTNNVDSLIQDVKQHIQKHMNALNLDKTYKDVFDNSILNGKPIFETQNLKNPIEGLVKDISSLQAFKEENQKQDKNDQSDTQNFNMGQNLQANFQDKTNEIKADNLFKEIEKTVLKESKNPVLMKNVAIDLNDGTSLNVRFNANSISIAINTNIELTYKDSQIKDLVKNLQNLGFSVENITINGTTIESQMGFSENSDQKEKDDENNNSSSDNTQDFEFINAV